MGQLEDSLDNKSSHVGILTHDQFVTLTLVEAGLLQVASILGVATNIVNVLVYVRMRQFDGVNVSFTALSCSDLLVSLLNLVYSISLPFFCMELKFGVMFTVDPYIPRLFFGNLTTMIYTVTMLISGYIAFVRCMCVAVPLRFKNSFTARRSVVFVAACVVFAGGVYIPLVANTGTTSVYSPELNSTRYVVWFSPYRKTINVNKRVLTQTILPFGTEILIPVCVIVMAWYLRKATKLRSRMMSTGAKPANKEHVSDQDSGLSRRDVQILSQVLQISILYVVLNTPMILHIVASQLVPGYDNNPGKDRYARLHASATPLRKLFEQLNSSLNFFIYYKYNPKFKKLSKL